MEKYRKAGKLDRLSVKILSVILLCILACITVFGGLFAIYAYDTGAINSDQAYYESRDCYRNARNRSYDALWSYMISDGKMEEVYNETSVNYGYAIVELAAEGGETVVYTYNYGTGKTGLTAEFFGYDVLGMHGAIETHDGKLINADDFAQKHVVRFMVYDPLVTED